MTPARGLFLGFDTWVRTRSTAWPVGPTGFIAGGEVIAFDPGQGRKKMKVNPKGQRERVWPC